MENQHHRAADAIRIDRARPDDIPRMAALLGELFTIEKDFAPDVERQIAGLRLLLDRPDDTVVFVARDAAGRAVALVAAQLVVSTSEGALSVWIEDVVVDAAHRRRGIGSALLDAALRWARDRGATRAQLLIDTENTPAEAFYARLGWRMTQLATRRLMLK